MKSKLLLVVYFVILIIFNFSTIHPCTTFVLQRENSIIFGRNLDWFSGTGLAIVNPRNLEKIALVDSSQNPIKWVAKYGSITFNQIGRELPFGGINVAGLVVEHMTLDKTVYPSRDDRYPISAYQWIQFQLDNYSTIEEVISSDTLLRIEDTSVKIHFLICDRFGHAAVIEFLDGKMVCRTGKDLPVRALANSTYDESMKSYNNSGSMSSDLSLANFCSAAKHINRINFSNNNSIIDYAFNTLKSVSQGIFTMI
jgi:penicillin V acylase-like amidase (Ntn superfamily)